MIQCAADRFKNVSWRWWQSAPRAWQGRIAGELGLRSERLQRQARRKIRLLIRAGHLHWGAK